MSFSIVVNRPEESGFPIALNTKRRENKTWERRAESSGFSIRGVDRIEYAVLLWMAFLNSIYNKNG